MMEQLKVNNITNRLTTVLFIIYLIALYWILLLKLGVRFSYMGERRTNLVPFSEPFLTSENILNVVIFVPLGIYAGILFENWLFSKKLFFVLPAKFDIRLSRVHSRRSRPKCWRW